jgi:hypothetical protein
MEVDAFPKKRNVGLEHTIEDLERDREAHRGLELL